MPNWLIFLVVPLGLIGGLGLGAWSDHASAAAATRYEYKSFEVGSGFAASYAELLNRQPGWEIVMVTQRGGYTTGVVMRRPAK